jgi:hypothetical protein
MNPSSVVSFAVCLLSAAGCAAGDLGTAFDAGASTDSAPGDAASHADSARVDAASSADAATGDAGTALDAPADAATADEPAADVAAPPPPPPPTTLDLHQVTLFDNPTNLADWPVTTEITDVEFQYMGSDGVHVEFSKQDGAGSWPDVTPPGWTGSLEYTLGIAEYIDGQWYGSAAIEFWRGLASAGGNVAEDIVTLGQCAAFGMGSSCQVAKNWYYDSRWGNLAGYQPATGEMIGVFVVAGNLRGVTDGSQSPVQERSNVVLVPMPGFGGAKYTF